MRGCQRCDRHCAAQAEVPHWQTAAAGLIGAPAYFGEIGFTVTPKNQLIFPGPQDQARVMVKDLAGDASQLSGRVTAAV